MNKSLIVLLLFLLSNVYLHAQKHTYYYKLEKVQSNGVTETKVDGGQFITFLGQDKCYESDYLGMSVGNGDLLRKGSSKTIFTGSSFWGDNSTFVFSTDFTSFTVKSTSGSTYYYKKCSQPDGEYSCSLIRSKGQSSSSGGSYTPTATQPNYNGNNGSVIFPSGQGGSSSSGNNSSTQKRWKNVRRTVDCPLCHHSGRCQTCNGKGWSYGIGGKTIECPNCDGYKTGRCRRCHGSGTIEKLEQVYE